MTESIFTPAARRHAVRLARSIAPFAARLAFNDRAAWARMAVLNVARIGKFSSDRAVAEYARDIWHVETV